MRINTNKLKGKMVEQGMTAEEVAKKVGMNPSTFYRKIKACGLSFTVAEMYKLVDVLRLSQKDAIDIFFAA